MIPEFRTPKLWDWNDHALHERDSPLLPGLSPVNGKALTARFDAGAVSSDAWLQALREVERRLDVAGRLAACIDDPRDPARIVHSVADILRFRILMIAAGYEECIDANALGTDPMFKMALERLPGAGDLCSQATVSRLESLHAAIVFTLIRREIYRITFPVALHDLIMIEARIWAPGAIEELQRVSSRR